MRLWRSLKYRIAVIIFLLEAAMMAFVLWGTLSYSLEKRSTQLASSEQAMLNIIGGLSRIALLTEEYADLQPYIEGVLTDPHVVRVMLVDSEGRVVTSTEPGDVGGPPPPFSVQTSGASHEAYFWRINEIANSAGRLGTLAIQFSHQTLLMANAEVRNLGIGIAGFGMLVIAIAGIATGHLLTRRLERLTAAANSVAKGELQVRIDVSGTDEIGSLAGSFREMVGSVAESQRRLREQADRFKLLLDSTGEGIFGLDSDGKCSFCNAACLAILGYDQAEQLLGQNMHRLIHHSAADGTSYPEEDSDFTKAYRDGQRGQARDGVLWRADGSQIVASYRVVPLRLNDATVGAVVSFRDVTEIRQGEAALRRSQKMASVAQLTGGIAHDFNNILGIAIGNLELLEATADDRPEVQDLLAKVRRALDRGAKLTKRLLLFAADTPQVSSPVDLNKIIGAMDDLIARSLTPQITVESRLADDLWLTEADPGAFEDVLINLALNARDAMDGAGRLVIETANRTLDENTLIMHPEARPGDYVALTLSDSGTGIPGDILDRIFEPFFTTKEPGKGTGLGLSMAYGFVTRLGGIIDVESTSGVGTSVHIYLPRCEGAAAKTDLAAVGLEEIPGGAGTILVVDDELDLLTFAATTLTQKGYQVLKAQNATEALEYLKTPDPIDLLFSDVVMPGGESGLDLALRARTLRPGLKVLLTSGFSDKTQEPNRYGNLLDNVLHKPYRGADLVQCVHDALKDRRGPA